MTAVHITKSNAPVGKSRLREMSPTLTRPSGRDAAAARLHVFFDGINAYDVKASIHEFCNVDSPRAATCV